MKLPASIGQKKLKAIEQVLEELGIGKFFGLKMQIMAVCCDF